MKKTSRNNPPPLVAAEIEIIVHVLAQTDALWSCPRVYSDPATSLSIGAWGALDERRDGFETSGLNFRISGNAQQRKESERLLGDLESKNMLNIFTHYGRRWGVRLTEIGDNIARYFAAEPLAYQSWPQLAELRRLVAAKCSSGPLVREDDLAKTMYGASDVSQKLVDLELELLPLKARLLVDDAADLEGRVWYDLTPAGEAAADGAQPKKPKLPKYQSGYCDTHTELVEKYLRERLEFKPSSPTWIHIPLSAGVGPDRSWQDLERKAIAKRRKPKG